jgi:hypothetical protein
MLKKDISAEVCAYMGNCLFPGLDMAAVDKHKTVRVNFSIPQNNRVPSFRCRANRQKLAFAFH